MHVKIPMVLNNSTVSWVQDWVATCTIIRVKLWSIKRFICLFPTLNKIDFQWKSAFLLISYSESGVDRSPVQVAQMVERSASLVGSWYFPVLLHLVQSTFPSTRLRRYLGRGASDYRGEDIVQGGRSLCNGDGLVLLSWWELWQCFVSIGMVPSLNFGLAHCIFPLLLKST